MRLVRSCFIVFLMTLVLLFTGCGAGKGPAENETAGSETTEGEAAESGTSKEKAAESGASIEEAAEGGTTNEEESGSGTSEEEAAGGGTSKEDSAENEIAEEEAAESGTSNSAFDAYVTPEGNGMLLFVNSSKYPALSKALDAWSHTPDAGDGDLYIRRADSHYFSFMQHIGNPSKLNGDGTYIAGSEWKGGWTFDTETGKQLKLTDVVANMRSLRTAIEDQVSEFSEKPGAVEYVREILLSDDPGSEGMSWTLGYEGLSVYFEDTDQFGFFAGRDRGTVDFFLPYAEYPGVFAPEVTDIPEAYTESVLFRDYYCESIHLDTDGDGSLEDVLIYADYDEERGLYQGFHILAGDSSCDAEIEPAADRPLAWAVHGADGKNWLYVQRRGDDGLNTVYVYGLDNSPSEAGILKDRLIQGSAFHNDRYYDPVSWNPQEFEFWNTEEGIEEVWPEERAVKLCRIGEQGFPEDGNRILTDIHPYSPDNIIKEGDSYRIRDNSSEEEYILDADTFLNPESGADLPGYEEGTPVLEWFESYLNAPMESGLAFGMGDIFEVILNGDHIDELRCIAWWD